MANNEREGIVLFKFVIFYREKNEKVVVYYYFFNFKCLDVEVLDVDSNEKIEVLEFLF